MGEEQSWRDTWEDYVFRTGVVTDATRVFLLAVLKDMAPDGRVGVMLPDVGARLQRGVSTLSARCKAAREAGVLEELERGRKGRPAVFRAAIPGRVAPALDASDSFDLSRTLSQESIQNHRTLSSESIQDHRKHSQESIQDHRTVSREDVRPVPNEPENSFDPSRTKEPDSFDPSRTDPPTYKEREVQESLKNASPTLFDDAPDDPAKAAPGSALEKAPSKRLSPEQSKLVNELVTVYYDSARRIPNWDASRAVVKAALDRDFTPEEIHRGLLRMAEERRYKPSLPSLAIAIDQTAPADQRPVLRALPGGMSRQARNQQATDALFDAAMERARAREAQMNGEAQ